MEEFVQSALCLTPNWTVSNIVIDHQTKKIYIDLDYKTNALPVDLDIQSKETMRHLSIFEYQTFITAPVLWVTENGKKTKRLRYPWEDNLSSDFNPSKNL